MKEIIDMIQQANTEEIQDVVQAAICRYRQLHPDWRIMFVSAKQDATDRQSRELLDLIKQAEVKFAKSDLTF